jgi:hypothetical protein
VRIAAQHGADPHDAAILRDKNGLISARIVFRITINNYRGG